VPTLGRTGAYSGCCPPTTLVENLVSVVARPSVPARQLHCTMSGTHNGASMLVVRLRVRITLLRGEWSRGRRCTIIRRLVELSE